MANNTLGMYLIIYKVMINQKNNYHTVFYLLLLFLDYIVVLPGRCSINVYLLMERYLLYRLTNPT